MKTLHLALVSYKLLRSRIVILMLVLTIALLTLSYLNGLINYNHYSIERLEEANFGDAVYLKLALPDDPESTMDMTVFLETIQERFEEISELRGIEALITQRYYGTLEFNDEITHVYAYDEATINRLNLPLRGAWFEPDLASADSVVQIVLGGADVDSNTRVGDIQEVRRPGSDLSASVRITGTLRYPGFSPSFRDASTVTLSQNLLSEEPVIFIPDDPAAAHELGLLASPMIYQNAWVILEDQADNEARAETLRSLNAYGAYSELPQIIEDSVAMHNRSIKELLPIPLFLFFSSITALFSIAALYVLQNQSNQVLYYLCGCSKQHLRRILALGLFPIVAIPVLITLIFILNYDRIRRYELFQVRNILINRNSILVVLLFAGVLMGLLLLIPVVIQGRKTPLDLYKRYVE